MKTSTYFKRFCIFLSLVALFSACDTPPAPSTMANVAQSSLKRIASPNVSSSDAQTLVDGNNAFALDIYQILSAPDGNLILSPFSMSLALIRWASNGASWQLALRSDSAIRYAHQASLSRSRCIARRKVESHTRRIHAIAVT